MYPVSFEVLAAANMKMAVFWIVAPCSLVEVYRRFRGTYNALMMEVARTSETLVNFYQITRRYNPEDSHLRNVSHCSAQASCRCVIQLQVT
jgi:hypothetical protein